jgi:hypothetical protein
MTLADNPGEFSAALTLQVVRIQCEACRVDVRRNDFGDDTLNVTGYVFDRQRCEVGLCGMSVFRNRRRD